ncbi:MAG: N-acetyltransferase family protein [Firmicutes bacterium]|nr:N-acetyltransferase family protein [Bacillota bacterium]
MENLIFRKVCEGDIPEVGEIFNYYVLNSTASFYFEPLNMDEIRKMVFFESERHGAFAAEEDGVIKGFCYVSPFNKREGYDGAAEITLYLKNGFTGMGIGSKAVGFLEDFSRQNRFRTLISVICGENQASIKLFEKMGYEKCALLKDIGKKFGRLLDVVYYQKML